MRAGDGSTLTRGNGAFRRAGMGQGIVSPWDGRQRPIDGDGHQSWLVLPELPLDAEARFQVLADQDEPRGRHA
jgi:hypothetical protein